MQDIDVARIAASPWLTYPIVTKSDFVAQMTRAPVVGFRGTDHDTAAASDLLPAFFFPLRSSDDLTAKATDLLVSRGLARAPHLPAPAPAPVDVPDLTRATPGAVVEYVAARVASGPRPEGVDEPWVDAIDYVTHAVEFAEPPDALAVWRAAVLEGELLPAAREAVLSMIDFVRRAASEGNWAAASEICDCMADLVDPDAAPQHVGGFR